MSDDKAEHRLVEQSRGFRRLRYGRPSRPVAGGVERGHAPGPVEDFSAGPDRTFLLSSRKYMRWLPTVNLRGVVSAGHYG